MMCRKTTRGSSDPRNVNTQSVLVIILFVLVNLAISNKIFTYEYLLNTLDFEAHTILVKNILEINQPFLGLQFTDSAPMPFYPQGSLYEIAVLSNILNIEEILFMKYTYILIASIIWPIVLWKYIESYNLKSNTSSKILIVGLTLNHMPYGYFYWGHLPTVVSIILALCLDIISKNMRSKRIPHAIYSIFIIGSLFVIHPVGAGTFVFLRIIRFLLERDLWKVKKFKEVKNQIYITISGISVVIFSILLNFKFFYPIRYQINQNYEKLTSGTTFEYDITYWERFVKFFYEWIINLKYINIPTLDFIYLLIFVIIILKYSSRKYLYILTFQVLYILSTAASQQVFPISLIALISFPFYSSASRMTHLTIIVYVLVLGKTLDLVSSKNRLVKVFTHVYTLLSFSLIFNYIFYRSI